MSLEGVTSLTAAGVPDPFPWISEGRSNILASRRGSVESNVSLNINSRRRGSADSTSSLPAFMQPGPHRASLNAAASAASAAVKAIKKLEDAERKLKQDIKFSLRWDGLRRTALALARAAVRLWGAAGRFAGNRIAVQLLVTEFAPSKWFHLHSLALPLFPAPQHRARARWPGPPHDAHDQEHPEQVHPGDAAGHAGRGGQGPVRLSVPAH